MNPRRVIVASVIGILLVASVGIGVAGEPSKDNPRRQDAIWNEENVWYDMTYLANRNVTAKIESPDIFEFNGSGTVVMWRTVWMENEDIPRQEHLVLKIKNGEIIRQKINEININASLRVTNNNCSNDSDCDNNDDDAKSLRHGVLDNICWKNEKLKISFPIIKLKDFLR